MTDTRQETCPHGLLPWECYYCKAGLPRKRHTLQPAPPAPYDCKVELKIAESAYGKPAVPPVPDEPRSAEPNEISLPRHVLLERLRVVKAALLSAQKDAEDKARLAHIQTINFESAQKEIERLREFQESMDEVLEMVCNGLKDDPHSDLLLWIKSEIEYRRAALDQPKP